MPFRAINLAILAQGPDRDTCPLMVGTVTGWRSLPSQPTAASIPRGYVHGFPKARLPFRHLSARYLHVCTYMFTRQQRIKLCNCCVFFPSLFFANLCVCVCEGINFGFSFCGGARAQQGKRTRFPESLGLQLTMESDST